MTRESARGRASLLGALFALGMWAASYVEVVPLAIYEPSWSYPVSSTADQIGYHLAYGPSVAAAYKALRRGAGA